MEKQWRSVVHEIATEMKMFSESVEVGESGDKFVIVQRGSRGRRRRARRRETRRRRENGR